jgi:Cys-tRNA(Pro)/Cys-tRNA(Cys) deacylase
MHPEIEIALKQYNSRYKEHLHTSYNTEINNPADFANALGYTIERITKSVLIRSTDRKKFAMAVCSVNKKFNFPELAKHMTCKKVEVASKEELNQLVGYPVNGVCPIGLRDIPVFMDSTLLTFETVLVGGGIPKTEIEIYPLDLQRISEATILSIIL